jgi:hypothetical protein
LNRKTAIQLAAFLLFVYSTCFLKLHLVRDGVKNSVLLWNSEEAYLFATWSRVGYHFTCFEYLVGYIPAFFGVNHTYDDVRSSIIVIRISPDGTSRYVVERNYVYDHGDRGFRAYFPVGQTIYAFDGGDPWKWAGTHFERVRPGEPYPVKAITDTSVQQEFQSVDGWSARRDISSWLAKSTIELDNKPISFFLKRDSSGDELSLKLQLPNAALQSLLHVNRNLHLVRTSTYKTMFEIPSELR